MIEIPKFKTEAEEAKWFAEHAAELQGVSFEGTEEDDALHRASFPKADKEKAVRDAKAFSARQGARSTAINIRIPNEDLEIAQRLAEKRGLKYQTLIKSILHEALEREAAHA